MKATAIGFMILLLASLALIVPAAYAQPYALAVSADDGALSLNVLVKWKNATGSFGALLTPSNLSDQQGELTLGATLTHIQGPSFYTFAYWNVTIDTAELPTGTKNIVTFNVTGQATATAHYSKLATVDKKLTDCYTLDENRGKVPCNPKEVPIGAQVFFNMSTTFETYGPLNSTIVKDGIGADLVLDGYETDFGAATNDTAGKGKRGVTIVTWIIGDIGRSTKYTLNLYVHTDVNPKNQQEYTSPGTHPLNDGPEAYFIYSELEYVLHEHPVEIIVV